MSKRAIVGVLLAIFFVAPSNAQERLGDPKLMRASTEHPLPSIATDFISGVAHWSDAGAKSALMRALSQWLSSNFDLPSTAELPLVALEAPARISAIRYGRLLSSAARDNVSAGDAAGDRTVAIYVDSQQTIYLPDTFTGGTPAELSVLVHELVHHMQNLAKLRFDCPQAREKTAYLAQQRWLVQFGQDLSDQFQVDPFTVLVHSACLN